MEEPWTRDGRVCAEVVAVAPDVSGLVDEVLVHDNQAVAAGDVLFRLNSERFALALRQAEAVVASRRAEQDRAERDLVRYRSLDNAAVSVQRQEQAVSDAAVARAATGQAWADRDLAKLNLDRSEIRAAVAGVVTNLQLRPGAYLPAGRPALALVDTSTLHVAGYFEETKLGRIQPGDPVRVQLLGDGTVLRGHVESIAAGIVDRERGEGDNLLANVNPTFSWVRLPQRVPVRVAIDEVPPGVRLVTGRTATVTVLPRSIAANNTDAVPGNTLATEH